MWLVTMLDQGFPNSAKEWADSLLWGEMRNFARGGDLSGGGNLRKSDFDHSNFFPKLKTTFCKY